MWHMRFLWCVLWCRLCSIVMSNILVLVMSTKSPMFLVRFLLILAFVVRQAYYQISWLLYYHLDLMSLHKVKTYAPLIMSKVLICSNIMCLSKISVQKRWLFKILITGNWVKTYKMFKFWKKKVITVITFCL